MSDQQGVARMELEPDAWHQNDDGNYYIECPECGSAATLMNVVEHNRCNGYLDQLEAETELDEGAMDCTAKLTLELAYSSDPEAEAADDGTDSDGSRPDDTDADLEEDDGVTGEGTPPGSEGTVDDEQQ
ncbi:hypothetical protein HALLA_19480 [Halostagnicola larsenii XH-48]|uniref:Uncharacterized protein n=1 Tax=Halostagnicola larsenii XH-48 TaxID=797299 RepID=W0JTS3_9EURY|nr:hypothetical protein [Halostagnicola larsenii]AHG00645.1 hypothetical protein HALLA_19480 [Halostagnicola larsenii XH-48]